MTVTTALLIIAVIAASWYFAAVIFLFWGLHQISPAGKPNGNTFSVIIAARNEAATIEQCLSRVCAQSIDPLRFEVIVVNDRSIDGTPEIVRTMQNRYASLSLITIEKTPPGISPKKYAVSQGVAAAKNDIIVFTDADCLVPRGWLETIDRHFTDRVGLVQGITSYGHIPGMNTLFYSFQAIDFISHGIVAAAAIGATLPINSNANNFSLRKVVFEEVDGYTGGIGHIVSGDDDLLLQKISNAVNWQIRFMAEQEGAVETAPTQTVKAFFQQRARWSSKTVHYHMRQTIVLSGIFMFYVITVVLLLSAAFKSNLLIPALAMIVGKLAGELLLMVPGLSMFKKKELLRWLPMASIVQLPLVVAAVGAGVFGKFSWKGQTFSRTIKPQKKEASPPIS